MNKQKGFGPVEIIVIVAVLALFAAGGWYIWQQNANKTEPAQTIPTQESNNSNGDSFAQSAKNTRVKADVSAVASAVTNYVSNNLGSYPATDEDMAKLKGEYIAADLNSPLTGQPYVLTVSSDYAKGTINLVKGLCNDTKTGVVAPTTSREHAVLSVLYDDTVYCVDL